MYSTEVISPEEIFQIHQVSMQVQKNSEWHSFLDLHFMFILKSRKKHHTHITHTLKFTKRMPPWNGSWQREPKESISLVSSFPIMYFVNRDNDISALFIIHCTF